MAIPTIDNFVFGETLASADLNAMLTDLGTLYNGGVADGSLTDAKLATSVKPEVLLATSSPSSANVSWTSISGSYEHLKIRALILGTDASARVLNMTFNNDTGSNYDYEVVAWNNATATGTGTAGATSAAVGTVPASGVSPRFFTYEIDVPFYALTSAYKSGKSLGARSQGTAAGDQFLENRAFFWRSTSAITRIDLAASTGTFAAGSQLRLYGIK